ncbi:hypothetical protein A165_19850 [Vibrio tasmaniensis ZS-17]|uniref:hypothetical protein n=1 Tax=Vibrio tasmaniensis TaxID=212663 RepID=UPI000313C8FF|nr:hypothetical protein [Vibrio tasmaniensis]OED61697.1 hypothetical protein A165_19850 [Vibrio tasmaniensis ZS-17]
MLETRGIAVDLGIRIMEMFLSEAKEKENTDIRLLLDSNRWKEMTDDELREARIKLSTYIGLAVENSRKYTEAYNDDSN